MSEQEFFRICVFMKSRYGIDLNKKKEIITGRLGNYIHSNGWKNYTEFMDAVESDTSGKLEKILVNYLTTNHTFFMRESEHFTYLRETVLPYLKKKEEKHKDMSIWCAASSSGEEPYTLAMIVRDFLGIEEREWDTKILATDVSTKVLQKAMAGIYTADQVEALPEAWKRRFFHRSANGETYEVTKELKDQVLFRKFNLMDPFPFKRKMHVVFLRNVMIYFDDKTKKELVHKIYNFMEPGGYLFIGQTETLGRDDSPFQIVTPSVYRKKEGAR